MKKVDRVGTWDVMKFFFGRGRAEVEWIEVDLEFDFRCPVPKSGSP
jgi:hypothetical protein